MVVDKSLDYLRRNVGEKYNDKIVAAYIGEAKNKILVDTGPPDMERALKYHPYAKSEPNRPEQNIEYQLRKAGVKPEKIHILISTHLHWDHVGEVTKFPNAQFIISKGEFRCALDPLPCLYVGYEALQIGMGPVFLKVIDSYHRCFRLSCLLDCQIYHLGNQNSKLKYLHLTGSARPLTKTGVDREDSI